MKFLRTQNYLLVFIFIFCSYYQILGQTKIIKVQGIVFDDKTNKKLAGAYITIADSGVAVTNKKGYFSFIFPSRNFTVSAKILGYKKESKTIHLHKTEKDINLFFRLKPELLKIPLVTINGEQFYETVKYKTYELQQGDIKHIPQFAEPDVIRSLHALPGINSMNDFANKIFVRGGNFDETLIMLDDVPVYNQNHLGGIFSMFNPAIVSSERLYPSNYPVNYGGYLSGTLNIKTKTGNWEKLKGSASIGLVSSNLFLELPVAKGTLIASARRTYLDFIASILGQSLPYHFYDVFFKYSFPFDKNNLIKISYFNSNDTYKVFEEEIYKNKKGSDEPSWRNNLFNFKFIHIFSKNLSTEVNIYFTRSISIANLSSEFNNNPTKLFIDNSISDFTGQLRLRLSLKGQKIETGIELKKMNLKYQWDIGKSELSEFGFKLEDSFYDFAENPFNYKATTFVGSGYLSDKIQINKNFSCLVGLRSTYLQKLSKFLFSPSANLIYRVNNDIKMNFSYRKYFQYFYTIKDQSNVMLDPYSVYFLQKSPNDIAKSDNFSIGINISNFYKNIRLELEGYYKNRKNLASSYSGTLNPYKFENGNAVGMDILLKKDEGKLSGWFSYSYLRSLKDNGSYFYFTRYDRTHSIKIVLNYSISEHWHFTSFWIYGTGLPYTPRVGKFIAAGSYPNHFLLMNINGKKNSVRTDNYHRLDIGFSGSFIWKTFFVKPYFQILNVYNSPNPIYEGKGYNAQTKRASFIVPTIGLSIEF